LKPVLPQKKIIFSHRHMALLQKEPDPTYHISNTSRLLNIRIIRLYSRA